MDKKYEITHHPNGEITEAIASVSLTYDIDDALDFDLSDAEFVFADE